MLILSFVSTFFMRAIERIGNIKSLIRPQFTEGAVVQLVVCVILYITFSHYLYVYLAFSIFPKILIVLTALTAYLMFNSIKYLAGF